jgi:hypothetical protein
MSAYIVQTMRDIFICVREKMTQQHDVVLALTNNVFFVMRAVYVLHNIVYFKYYALPLCINL